MEAVPKGLCEGSWRGEAVRGRSHPWEAGRSSCPCAGVIRLRAINWADGGGAETLLQWGEARGARVGEFVWY